MQQHLNIQKKQKNIHLNQRDVMSEWLAFGKIGQISIQSFYWDGLAEDIGVGEYH